MTIEPRTSHFPLPTVHWSVHRNQGAPHVHLPRPDRNLRPTQAPIRNPAVEHCCQAREAAIQQAVALGLDEYKITDAGEEAYLKAMPNFLSIRDFIACVACGMINGAIHPISAPKYFYAAQVAVSALRQAPKPATKPNS